MKFSQAMKMAFVALKGNKMRSFLTMLGIIIGVMSVVLLISLVQGAQASITESIEGLGSNLLTVNVMSPKTTYMDIDDVLELLEHDEISAVSPVTSANKTIKSSVNSTRTSVDGVDPIFYEINGLELDSGRFIADMDVEFRTYNAVIGSETAEELFGTMNSVGGEITIDGIAFTVVGVLVAGDEDSFFTNDNKVIIPITTAQRIFRNKEIGSIYISASSPETVDAAEEKVNDFMIRILGDEDYFRVMNQSAILSVMDEAMGIMTALLGGIAGISLLVGGIGIMNIMLVSVSERTREIGIRKAIGAQKRDILSQFLIEAITLCILGGLFGMLLGYIGLLIAGAAMNMSLGISASTAALAVGFSIAVGLGFGMYPANKAANLRPIEALRYE